MEIDIDALKEAKLDQARRHADPEWKAEILRWINVLCSLRQTFTTDDLWEHAERHGLSTPNPSAIGALISAAVRRGQIVEVGRVKSRRPSTHGRRIGVYIGKHNDVEERRCS